MSGSANPAVWSRQGFHEIRLEPSRVISTELVSFDGVPAAEIEAFRNLLDTGCEPFSAEIEFLDLEEVELRWVGLSAQSALAVLLVCEVHIATLGLFPGGDPRLDQQDIGAFHEGLSNLSLRIPSEHAVLPAARLPGERPALFVVLLDADELDALPTLHRLIRALAVAFFCREEREGVKE